MIFQLKEGQGVIKAEEFGRNSCVIPDLFVWNGGLSNLVDPVEWPKIGLLNRVLGKISLVLHRKCK